MVVGRMRCQHPATCPKGFEHLSKYFDSFSAKNCVEMTVALSEHFANFPLFFETKFFIPKMVAKIETIFRSYTKHKSKAYLTVFLSLLGKNYLTKIK